MAIKPTTYRLAGFALLAGLATAAPSLAQANGTPPVSSRTATTHHHSTIHRHGRHATMPATQASLHTPPPDRPAQPPAEGPAPVPNQAVTAPLDNSRQQETEVEPSVFQLHYPPQGEGYITGSSPQAMDDRNAAKATGVEVTIPLHQ